MSTSGTVISQETYRFFSPLSTRIGKIDAQQGEGVKKGEILLRYEEEALKDLKTVTELSLKANRGGLSDQLEKNNKQQGLYREATINLEVLEQQIADTRTYIDTIQKKINDKQVALEHHGMLLELSRLEWANQPDSEEYQNLLKLIQQNQYEQKNHKDLISWKEEVDKYTKILEEYKAYETEMKAQESSSEGSKLSKAGKEQVEANSMVEAVKLEKTMKSINENEKGILAPFNGIITSMEAIEGKTVQEGELLFTLESLDKMAVTITINKYELERIKEGQKATITIAGKSYEGKVQRIEKMATKNSSGASVVEAYVEILKPDQNIFLGVEAKVKIDTGKAMNVMAVPVAAVNTDISGTFVYVVKDGVMQRRDVVTGLTTELEIEIKEGLKEGEEIVTEMKSEISEEVTVLYSP